MAPLPGALEVLLQGFGYTMLTAFLSAVLRTIVIMFYFFHSSPLLEQLDSSLLQSD